MIKNLIYFLPIFLLFLSASEKKELDFMLDHKKYMGFNYNGYKHYEQRKKINIPESSKWVFYISTSSKSKSETLFVVYLNDRFIGWRESVNWKTKNGRKKAGFKSYPEYFEKGTYEILFYGDNKQGENVILEEFEFKKPEFNDKIPELEEVKKNSSIAGDLRIVPAKGSFFPERKNILQIDRNGRFVDSSENDLGSFLWEKKLQAERGKGPTFKIDAPRDGKFTVKTSMISKKSIIQITLDDKSVLKKEIDAYEYGATTEMPKITKMIAISIPLLQGKHIITVENVAPSGGWVKIAMYVFENIFTENSITQLNGGMQWRVMLPTTPFKDHLLEVAFKATNLSFGTLRVSDYVISSFQGHQSSRIYKDVDDKTATYCSELPAAIINKEKTEIIFGVEGGGIFITDIKIYPDKKFPIKTQKFYNQKLITKQLNISKEKNYFVDEYGVGKFLMGMTFQFPSDEMDDRLAIPKWGWIWETDPNVIIHFIEKMAHSGVNHLRIIFNNANLENKIGKFNDDKYRNIDTILNKCRALGIYVTVSLACQQSLTSISRSHHQKNPLTDLFPKNMTDSKMIKNKSLSKKARFLLMSDKILWNWYKKSIKFNMTFLENRPEIMGIQIISEGHVGDEEHLDWHKEMAGEIKNYNQNMLVNASAVCILKQFNDNITINNIHENLTKLATENYIDTLETSIYRSWGYTENTFYKTLKLLVEEYNKPVFIGETDWFMNPEFTWQSLWASIMAGTSGFKVWGILTDYHLALYRPAAWLTQKIDFARFNRPFIGDNKEDNNIIISKNYVRYLISGNGEQALIWIDGEDKGIKIKKINGIIPYLWYDPWTGEELKKGDMMFNKEGTDLIMPHVGEKKKTVFFVGNSIR